MKNKIFSLILILTIFFGFGMIVKADIYIDDEVYIIDFNDDNYGESDLPLLLDLGNKLINYFEVEYGTQTIITDTSFIDTNFTNLTIYINNYYYDEGQYTTGFALVAEHITINNINFRAFMAEHVPVLQQVGVGDFYINFDFLVPPPPSPFTGLINFIKNLLQDLLQSITDMTMHLINNIFDTNLIDINLVVLSDTAIYTGTLNDMLYIVFSIFYVIFAIILVWRVLRKIIRKLFFWDRW